MIQVSRKFITNDNTDYNVYCHENKKDGKKYIGMTKNPKQRFAKKGKYYKGSKRFEDAISKYGWNGFIHNIIISNLTKDEAKQIENLLIESYNTTNIDYGYNIDDGTNNTFGGKHHTEKTKLKISNSSKGKHKGEKNSMYGKCWIYKDNVNKVINKEELDYYIQQGYCKGRV